MKLQNKLCLSLLATLSLVAGSASAGTAHDDEEAPDPGLPMETDGYEPVADDYYDDLVIWACGGARITLKSGDVQEVEQKIRVKHDGSVVIKTRGGFTNDVIAEPGGDLPHGGFIDELDISGAGTERISADGMTVVTLAGPSLIFPADAAQTAALGEAGLPELSYFADGKLKFEITPSKAASEPESVEVLKNTTRGVVDLCQALKESAGHSY